MTTGLWIATCGIPASVVTEAVPPTCRRRLDTLSPRVDRGDGDTLIEAPAWPAAGATHFVPSFAALTDAPYSVRLELSVHVGGAWSPWVAGAGLGPASFAPQPSAGPLVVDIDVFRTTAPVEAARLRARVSAPAEAAVLTTPWMLTLSAADGTTPMPPRPATATPGTRLEIPARSQMAADPTIASRICSPTCVAMVLDFWRRPAGLVPLAAEMFHPGLDLYGVWPAAIKAAGRRGLAGYLLRFPDWPAAAWCLGRGLPVIASVRYAAGELTGAAAAQTPGHLLVVTGWEGDDALVNDPAAPAVACVGRRYRIDELARVWLERSGVGFVIFPPERLRGG
jgi:Peptidase_C39 like family